MQDAASQPIQNGSQGPVLPNRGGPTKRLVAILITILILIANGVLVWQFFGFRSQHNQLNADKKQLQQQVKELESAIKTYRSQSNTSERCKVPSESLKMNIKSALDTKNTAVFSTYTTDPVGYVLAASEYGGDVSSEEAAASLSYTHSATGPWNFELSAATLDSYDSGFYADYFDSNTYVGQASSGMVVAFDFDCQDKITQIFVAADESLLLP